MKKIFSVSFWTQTFMSTLMTMFFIYLMKALFSKVNVPVVSEVVQSV